MVAQQKVPKITVHLPLLTRNEWDAASSWAEFADHPEEVSAKAWYLARALKKLLAFHQQTAAALEAKRRCR